eukprot:2272377-Alexandrium_andersonii.AAC.1
MSGFRHLFHHPRRRAHHHPHFRNVSASALIYLRMLPLVRQSSGQNCDNTCSVPVIDLPMVGSCAQFAIPTDTRATHETQTSSLAARSWGYACGIVGMPCVPHVRAY